MKKFVLCVFLLFFVSSSSTAQELNMPSITEKLTFSDLVQLSSTPKPEGILKEKLDHVLHTPIVDNSISEGGNFSVNSDPMIGEFVRIASWNIDRGFSIDRIAQIFTDPASLLKEVKSVSKKDLDRIEQEIRIIKDSNIIVLSEVDLGMPRTGYKNVAEDLAKKAGFNYAYGVEFVEVDPSHLGLVDSIWSEEKYLFPKGYKVEKSKYRGLHGSAILSRFPIHNVRIIRLSTQYDWFNGEKQRVSELEALKRKAAETVFREGMITEVRHGSRIALVADVDIPGLAQPLTVVSLHLENRTPPYGRKQQMEELLHSLRKIKNPVVIAGDLNTTCTDGSPTSIRKEILKKINDPEYIIKTALIYAMPHTVVLNAATTATNFTRKYSDPTVRSFPVVAPNPERGLFNLVNGFKFQDGYTFDFRGEKGRTVGSKGFLGDSNERSVKGFVPTFIFERPLFVGKYKLDWFFVKPYITDSDNDDPYMMAPHYGRTLYSLNYDMIVPISDHAPITVDLPLFEPVNSKKQGKHKKHNLIK